VVLGGVGDMLEAHADCECGVLVWVGGWMEEM
jgi:hypothetical protein